MDIQGRAVRRLSVSPLAAPAPRALTWDGRDSAARVAPAGVYFVRARAGGQTRVRQFAWLP